MTAGRATIRGDRDKVAVDGLWIIVLTDRLILVKPVEPDCRHHLAMIRIDIGATHQ